MANCVFDCGKSSNRFAIPLRQPVLACGGLLLAMAVVAPAAAQSGAQQTGVRDSAVNAVTSPLSDLNLRSKAIPEILLQAEQAPYDLTEMRECANLQLEVARLDTVLGRDSDAPPEDGNLLASGLQAGGSLISGFIPFRGLVREISGANAAATRWETVIYAGVTRRSFLKGYMRATQCGLGDERTVAAADEAADMERRSAARARLGLPPREVARPAEVVEATDTGLSDEDPVTVNGAIADGAVVDGAWQLGDPD